MSVRNILRIGNPILRMRSEEVPISEICSKEIKDLVKDMFDSMKAAQGIGLAAPQIGVLKRVVIVGYENSERYPEIKFDRVDGEYKFRVLINPVIEPLTDEVMGFWEGCLSVPGMRGYVERPKKIRLQFYDLEEVYHDEIIEGFEAIVVQHECDHLDGILYVDRLKDTKLFGYDEELDKAKKQVSFV
ncbi:MAG: peptide deformylase [Leptospiraceae bacterium]|nr:peptide deformylase [Leptospiraceae bacterium]MDW7975546.1 peptide deformylase [Leptospiraceae bacterium]